MINSRKQGQDREEEKEWNRKLLEIAREVQGARHPATLQMMFDLANRYRMQGAGDTGFRMLASPSARFGGANSPA